MVNKCGRQITGLMVILWGFLLQSCGGGGGGGDQAATVKENLPAITCEVKKNPLLSNSIGDRLFSKSWHLVNTGQFWDMRVGEDYQVVSAWKTGITGECVKVAVVDEGLAISHEDLASNILSGYSYNYFNNSTDPSISSQGTSADHWRQLSHGTSVGGIIAGTVNSVGSLGVAPRAKILGFNILEGNPSISDVSQAMVGQVNGDSRRLSVIDVSNNSWGASRRGDLYSMSQVWLDAVSLGVREGRQGKGIVYLFAAGNEGLFGADTNHSSLTNNRFVMVVGGSDAMGKSAAYSQAGATVLVSGLTQGYRRVGSFSGSGVVTSTLSGKGKQALDASANYTDDFNGTSAATPGVSGVVALMLQANPDLSWRDVRWILAKTARKVDTVDSGWQASPMVSGSLGYHHQYGFGVANASAAVDMALNNSPRLGAEKSCSIKGTSGQFGQVLSKLSTTIQFDTSTCAGMTVEFVEVSVNFDHEYFGELSIQLKSPQDLMSRLANPHDCYNQGGTLDVGLCRYTAPMTWRFGSVRHLGEALKSSNGIWQLAVSDTGTVGQGKVYEANITFWGH
jgi:proprotein convertase subtilisin/kexin type 2